MPGYTNLQLQDLVRQLEAAKLSINGTPLVTGLRNAFKTKPFIYGTQGKRGGGLRLGSIMAASINNRTENNADKTKNRPQFSNGQNVFSNDSQGYAFQTGARQVVQRKHNYQMMDMYYGDGGKIGNQTDPFILEFILYATKLKPLPTGPSLYNSSPTNHPFFMFKALGVNEGWAKNPVTAQMYGKDAFRKIEMTGTKELSRIIRWCVGEFGGTIIFEGADVYYEQVFDKKNTRFGDTELEATDFFQYFRPGYSEAYYGKGRGKVVFYWQGKETVPSKLLFLTSWKHNAFAEAQWYKLIHQENFEPGLKDLFGDSSVIRPTGAPTSWGGETFNATHTTNGYGSPVYKSGVAKPTKKIDAKTIESYIENITSGNELWRSFSTLPVGVAPWAIGDWLEKMK